MSEGVVFSQWFESMRIINTHSYTILSSGKEDNDAIFPAPPAPPAPPQPMPRAKRSVIWPGMYYSKYFDSMKAFKVSLDIGSRLISVRIQGGAFVLK